MPNGFEERLRKKRAALARTTPQLQARVDEAPYGPISKDLLHRSVEVESNGQVGFGLFDCPPLIVKGQGARVWDADGKEYVDLLSGFSASNIGQANAELVEAITVQARELMHYFDFPTPPRVELAEKLAGMAPGGAPSKVLFGTTGSDAIENAVKLARYNTGAPLILTAFGDYHGTSAGSMAMTAKGGMWAFWYPVLPQDSGVSRFPYAYCYRCPYGKTYPDCGMYCVQAVRNQFASKESPYAEPHSGVCNVAAIVIEPFQSSAGYIIPPDEFLQGLRELCDDYDMLLIVDEIQTGMARSGKSWASNHSGVTPDILVAGKALGGGLPISAIIARRELFEAYGPGAHVSTFGGYTLGCAAALKVLEIMARDQLIARAADRGTYFLAGLEELYRRHPLIGLVQGRGLYLAIEFVRDRRTKEPAAEEAAYILNRIVEDGLLLERGGYYYNRFQIIPPLVISELEIDRALEILDRAVSDAEVHFGIASSAD